MSLAEARKVLNVSRESPADEAALRFQRLFKLNDPKNGGSFYVQSKIVRALEALRGE